MKIPSSVRIGGVDYSIRHVPNLNDGEVVLYGSIDYDNSIICLSSTSGTEHQRQCITLWHEILHGIAEHAEMQIEEEEKIVEMFARGIYQVLQDNGAKFFDLKE